MRKLHIKYPFTIQVSQGWPGLRFHILITGQPGMRAGMRAHCLHGSLGSEGGREGSEQNFMLPSSDNCNVANIIEKVSGRAGGRRDTIMLCKYK